MCIYVMYDDVKRDMTDDFRILFYYWDIKRTRIVGLYIYIYNELSKTNFIAQIGPAYMAFVLFNIYDNRLQLMQNDAFSMEML